MPHKKEEPKYYVPLEPTGMCIFGPRADKIVMAVCVTALGGIMYAKKNDNVFTYTREQLPQLHQAFSGSGEGRCVGHDGKQEVVLFEKKTSLANCFEGAREALTSNKLEYLSFGLKGADGKGIAYGRCVMNAEAPQGFCSVEVPNVGRAGDVTYKISF